jgi:hypothetical protein
MTRNLHFVGLFDTVTWVRQAKCEVAIVCQKKESLTVFVETTDGVDPLRNMINQVNRKGASRWVMIGAEVSLGLVYKPIDDFFLGDRLAINGNNLSRSDLGGEAFDTDPIQGDAACFDHFVALPTGTNARMCQIFIDPVQFAHENLSMVGKSRLVILLP